MDDKERAWLTESLRVAIHDNAYHYAATFWLTGLLLSPVFMIVNYLLGKHILGPVMMQDLQAILKGG